MFKLPAHVQEKFAAARADEEQRKAVFANLDNADLVASAKFWMQHCEAPQRFPAGEPVYDSTFWHVIIPELLRRVSKAGPLVCGACGQPWTGEKCGQAENGWPFQTCFPMQEE